MPGKNLKLADEFAADYDNSILGDNWNGPAVIYNAANNLINANTNFETISRTQFLAFTNKQQKSIYFTAIVAQFHPEQ